METSKLVTCVITTYNRSSLVSRAIDSAINQTYPNIEIIVIDDHYSESYAEVREKYSQYNNVRFFRNDKNMGLAASRNRGISLAKSPYVAFLDDDDQWLPSKIEIQVKFLTENPKYVACSSHHIESISKKVIGPNIEHLEQSDIVCFNIIGPPSKLMIDSNKVAISFDENAKHAEDWDFYIRLLKLGPVFMIKQPLIIYDTVHFGRMTTGFAKLTIEGIQAKAHMTYKNRALIGENNFKERMAEYYLNGIFQRNGKFKFMQNVYKEIGFLPIIKVFSNKLKRALK